MNETAPTPSTNKADKVFERVRADILACRIQPSEKIRINELTEKYGVSLGAVREALSRLISDGLVIAEPQRGFRSAPVDRQDLKDLTEARVRIEGICLEEAITYGDLEWEGAILAVHHRLSHTPIHLTKQNALNPDWAEVHSEFHDCLVQACPNAWLLKLRWVLYERSERYRHLSVPMETSERDVAGEHKMIMDAVLSKDAELAAKLMGEHLRRTSDIILASGTLQS